MDETPDNPGNRRTAKGQFPKGVSGNPSGRPKSASLLREKLSEEGEALVAKLVEQSKAGDTTSLLRALEYVMGKPVTQVELAGRDGGPLQVSIAINRAVKGDE